MQSRPSKPAVTVIVTTFNSGAFIDAALTSVLNQTFRGFEVIVVDGDSTDDTVERVRRYRDDRLRLVHASDRGQWAQLNRGIAEGRSDLIAILDPDDIWRPEKLQAHLAVFDDHPEANLTFSWSRLIDKSGRELKLHSRHWTGAATYSDLLTDYVVGNNSSYMVRRAAIEQAGLFDEHLQLNGDVDFCLRVALLGDRSVRAVPGELTLYRRHSSQASRNRRVMEQEWFELFDRFLKKEPERTRRARPQAESNVRRFLAYLAWESGNYRDACVSLRRGFQAAPWHFVRDLRNWKLAAACAAGLALPGWMAARLEAVAKLKGKVAG